MELIIKFSNLQLKHNLLIKKINKIALLILKEYFVQTFIY